ncbi:MAG: hypothetical protein DCC75_10400, partial [Proteobacteria bacterium]
DNQIAREMQRDPSKLAAKGVTRWEPFSKRIELIAAFALEKLGNNDVDLDSIIVLAQSYVKALALLVEDLGQGGLGKMRTGYCLDAMERIAADAERGIGLLRESNYS